MATCTARAAISTDRTSDTVLAPVGASERIQVLDVLRGLALLGIFLMNVEFFSRSLMELSTGIEPGLSPLDWLVDAFVYMFVTSKFWTLFSLLFGMGFAVMLSRAQAADRPFVWPYLRRTLGLLAIGLAHGLFLWAGDILFSYALAAFALVLFFRETPKSRLWKWGGALFGAVVLMLLAGAAAMATMGADPETAASAQANASAAAASRDAEIAAYASGTYAEANAVRLEQFLHTMGDLVFLLPLVLGMFLVGAWLVRSGAMADLAGHRRLFSRLAWAGGLLGLALTAGAIAIEPNPVMGPTAPSAAALAAMALHMAGAPLMALGYVGLVVLASLGGARWLGVLAPAGRMALTNYLLQSLVGTLLFYGYGLGLWGEVSRAGQVVLVLVVFPLQVAASHWWLARFRFGPVEWLWRAFTYWRWSPMRRASAVPATA